MWARKDRAGYRYQLVHYGRNKWTNPLSIRNGISKGDHVFGGFLRRYGKSPFIPWPTRDYQYAYRLRRIAGRKINSGAWAYTHVAAKGNNWRAVAADFIKQQKPNHAGSIFGGLSRGRDFHLWVRKGSRNCNWALRHKQLPAKPGTLLNGTIKAKIAARTLAPLGFNYSSPSHLWYAELASSSSCLK